MVTACNSIPNSVSAKYAATVDNGMIRSLVADVATTSLKELALSSVMIGVTCPFIAGAAIPGLALTSAAVIGYNTLIRSVSAKLTHDIHNLKDSRSPEDVYFKYLFEKMLAVTQFLCPLSFSILDQTTTAVLTHEAGHALGAASVYQNSKAEVEIFLNNGGVTRYRTGSLSSVGNFFGPKVSRLCVVLAGPAAGILLATAQIGIGEKIKKKHPKLAIYLQMAGVVSVANHVLYALSALWQSNPSSGHDFNFLWKVWNVHPAVSAISMIALPVIVKSVIYAMQFRQDAAHK